MYIKRSEFLTQEKFKLIPLSKIEKFLKKITIKNYKLEECIQWGRVVVGGGGGGGWAMSVGSHRVQNLMSL